MGSTFPGAPRPYRGLTYWNVQAHLWDRMTLPLCADIRNPVRSKTDMVPGAQAGLLMPASNSCVGAQIQVEGARAKGNLSNAGGHSSWAPQEGPLEPCSSLWGSTARFFQQTFSRTLPCAGLHVSQGTEADATAGSSPWLPRAQCPMWEAEQ